MKIINNFNLDLSDLPATSETRTFRISADSGAVFSLEIKNEDSHYYNFATEAFQVAKAGLYNKVVSNAVYSDKIVFPAISDDDHYDIFLFAEGDTRHAPYREVRFDDGSIDVNSSKGSDSLLMKKIIYQYTDITLTLATYTPTSAFSTGSLVNDTFTLSRGRGGGKSAFTISCSSASGASFKIKKQPDENDILSFLEPTVGIEPETLPGENEHPTDRPAFTGDDVNGAVTSGSVVRMDNTDLSAAIEVGDRITTAVTTDTVNGAVTTGVAVTMDVADCATIMAVGDRVTGNAALNAKKDANAVTVTAINVNTGSGADASKITLSESVTIANGTALTFTQAKYHMWAVNNTVGISLRDILK